MVALVTSCSKSKNNGLNKYEYVAVQLEKGDSWSIIDAKGKVVVDGEYDASYEVSGIVDGAFWVKGGDGYQLFKTKDPKKPVNDMVYKKATMFVGGRAAISNPGEQIRIIDTNGKEVKVMPDNIAQVYRYGESGYAKFKDAKGLYGLIDRSGNVKLQAVYSVLEDYNEGIWIAKKDEAKKDEHKCDIINSDGKTQGVFDGDKYKFLGTFGEGLAAVKNNDTGKLEFINKKGEVELTLKKGYLMGSSQPYFIDGYAVVINEDHKSGVIDKKGETIIRPKYDSMENLGGGMFAASKKGEWGVIDKKDNTVVDFDYDMIFPLQLGDNIIALEGDVWVFIRLDGEKKIREEYHRISFPACDEYVNYVNINAVAQNVTDLISVENIDGVDASTTAATLAKRYELSDEDAKSHQYSKSIDTNMDFGASDAMSSTLRVYYKQKPVNVLSHTEAQGSGWFRWNKTVIDGYEYSAEALPEYADISLSILSDDVEIDTLFKLICDKITEKGFVTFDQSIDTDTSKTFKPTGKDMPRVTVQYDGSQMHVSYYFPTES